MATGAVTSCRPVIVLYHDVPSTPDGVSLDRETFERQIQLMSRHFELVSPGDPFRPRRALDRIRVLVTFDDGFRNNVEVAAPILRKYGVPALFFICSRHATPGRYLWFAYLRALERHFPERGFVFRGEFEFANDPRNFFNEEDPAVLRIARSFAESIVSTLINGFGVK